MPPAEVPRGLLRKFWRFSTVDSLKTDFLRRLYSLRGDDEKLITLLQQSYESALVKMPPHFADDTLVQSYIMQFKEILFQLL